MRLVLLYSPVADQLFSGAGILSFAQPGELLGTYSAGEAIGLGQLAMPLTLNGRRPVSSSSVRPQ